MAIALDAVSNSTYQSGVSSLSWSHTCTGANGFLAVDISLLSATDTVTAMTYAGVNMVLIGAQSITGGTGRIECWGLAGPATGSNTISVSLSGTLSCSGEAVSYTGVNQATPTEAFNAATTTFSSGTYSVVVTTLTANDWVHAAIATSQASITAGQTNRNNVTGASGSGANEDTNGTVGIGATTMSWSGMSLFAYAIGGYGIITAAAPPAPVGTLRQTNQAVQRAATI